MRQGGWNVAGQLAFVTGPGPIPRPTPLNGPGWGVLFYGCLPLPPAPAVPQMGPLKTGGEKRVPIQGMSGDSPRMGAGRGSPPK